MAIACQDLHEAVERLSASLYMRVEAMVRPWGWPVKPYSWMVSTSDGAPNGRLITVVATTVYLPMGRGASFTPRAHPKGDGRRWVIDIRRTDRVQRGGWAEGLTVAEVAPGQYDLLLRGEPLTGPALSAIFYDLAQP